MESFKYPIPFHYFMVTRIGGFRSRTRDKLKKGIRQRGKISVSKYFQEFKTGDKVNLSAEPAVQKGMYHPRYMNKNAVVLDKTGEWIWACDYP